MRLILFYALVMCLLLLAVTTADSSLFSLLVIRCVVQLELIQAIDNIVFYPTITRQDDQNILQAARVSA